VSSPSSILYGIEDLDKLLSALHDEHSHAVLYAMARGLEQLRVIFANEPWAHKLTAATFATHACRSAAQVYFKGSGADGAALTDAERRLGALCVDQLCVAGDLVRHLCVHVVCMLCAGVQ